MLPGLGCAQKSSYPKRKNNAEVMSVETRAKKARRMAIFDDFRKSSDARFIVYTFLMPIERVKLAEVDKTFYRDPLRRRSLEEIFEFPFLRDNLISDEENPANLTTIMGPVKHRHQEAFQRQRYYKESFTYRTTNAIRDMGYEIDLGIDFSEYDSGDEEETREDFEYQVYAISDAMCSTHTIEKDNSVVGTLRFSHDWVFITCYSEEEANNIYHIIEGRYDVVKHRHLARTREIDVDGESHSLEWETGVESDGEVEMRMQIKRIDSGIAVAKALCVIRYGETLTNAPTIRFMETSLGWRRRGLGSALLRHIFLEFERILGSTRHLDVHVPTYACDERSFKWCKRRLEDHLGVPRNSFEYEEVELRFPIVK